MGYILFYFLCYRYKLEIYILNFYYWDCYFKMYRIEYEFFIMCNKNVFDGKL